MSSASPFGQYAAAVAAIASLGILGAWLATSMHLGGLQASPELGAAALIVLGAIFGTGAGALVVANGVGRQAAVANTRLDAMHAPAASVAQAMVASDAAAAGVAGSEPPPPPPAGGDPG